jgi:hypothetical protein
VATPRLRVTRAQILAYRRRVGALDERLPFGPDALRRAAWVGLQDSMPRAAVLSIHARVADTQPSSWEDPSLVQVWGPRFSAYVVAARDIAVFTLGRLSDHPARRRRATDMAGRIDAYLGGRRMAFGEVGRGLGESPNMLRYAAPTGSVLIRWDGARQPTIWTVPAPDVDPAEARLELVRRFLHVFGPTTGSAFLEWAGIRPVKGWAPFDALATSLIAARTPVGEGWMLASDEPQLRSPAAPPAAARLLPSGDAYYLLQGAQRELLVPEPDRRNMLWTSRVWPGAVLVAGEIVGTWRRAQEKLTIQAWRRLTRAEHGAVEAEAQSLPLPGLEREIAVSWDDGTG